ncbi:MAG: hypothetical protein VW835_19505, partial [Rickettsiales bacterium]
GGPTREELIAEAAIAVEAAGFAGLCREGQRELAIDRLRGNFPDCPLGEIASTVDLHLKVG